MHNYALKGLAASQASTYLNLIPVLGVLTAAFALGEHIRLLQILGGLVILAGVLVNTRD